VTDRHPQLPNLLIPGYHKGGTTTLFTELARHPQIFPSLVKEPFYFRPYINGKPLAPIENYLKNFSAAKDEIYRMEGSPTYIYGGLMAAEKIKETLGEVKLIVSIRNPIDQLFSLYKHKLRFLELPEDMSFYQFVQEREDNYRQYYDLHLTEWFSVFGDNLKIIFFDDLIQKPEEVIHGLVNWLGLSPLPQVDQVLSNTNPGGTYRNRFTHRIALAIFHRFKDIIPHGLFLKLRKFYYRVNGGKITHTLTPEAEAYLKDHFRPHNQALLKLLEERGYDHCPEWLRQAGETP